ncbi:MAG: hypothetical protein ACP5NV_06430 [Candidatus Woesearchaeota archaeon]
MFNLVNPLKKNNSRKYETCKVFNCETYERNYVNIARFNISTPYFNKSIFKEVDKRYPAGEIFIIADKFGEPITDRIYHTIPKE